MLNRTIPAEGPIELELTLDLDKMTNGEKRILSQETGLKSHVLAADLKMLQAAQKADGAVDTSGVELDPIDFEYALGRIGLRRTFGPEADTPANADRVVFVATPAGADPTSPATAGD